MHGISICIGVYPLASSKGGEFDGRLHQTVIQWLLQLNNKKFNHPPKSHFLGNKPIKPVSTWGTLYRQESIHVYNKSHDCKQYDTMFLQLG